MTRKFEVGQRVWSFMCGWGKITSVSDSVIIVRPELGDYSWTFRADGTYHNRTYHNPKHSDLPILFHNEVKLEDWPNPKPPKPDLKIDDPVWVKVTETSDVFEPRHFAGWSGDELEYFSGGRTSHSGRDTFSAVEYRTTKPQEGDGK